MLSDCHDTRDQLTIRATSGHKASLNFVNQLNKVFQLLLSWQLIVVRLFCSSLLVFAFSHTYNSFDDVVYRDDRKKDGS